MDSSGIAGSSRALAGLAGLAAHAGSYTDAARLFGAADALREATATFEIPTIRPVLDRDLADVRAALDEQAFAAAWTEGHAMTLEQALDHAREVVASIMRAVRSASTLLRGIASAPPR